MPFCPVTYDLNQYLDELDRADQYEQALLRESEDYAYKKLGHNHPHYRSYAEWLTEPDNHEHDRNHGWWFRPYQQYIDNIEDTI